MKDSHNSFKFKKKILWSDLILTLPICTTFLHFDINLFAQIKKETINAI